MLASGPVVELLHRRGVHCGEAEAVRNGRGADPVPRTQLAEQVRNVNAGSLSGNEEAVRDLLVGPPCGKQRQDFRLPGCQAERVTAATTRAARRAVTR